MSRVEVRRREDGRIEARRKDHQPLTPQDREEARQLAETQGLEELSEGRIIAVLIDSPIVGPVWFGFADNFKSGDDIPVFFASELSFLQKMSETELRRRYEEKRALGGGWIRDRIDEPTKH